MDTVVVVPDVAHAALPPPDRACALACANLRWLLLVSGWARRAAFLWAVLPVLAICVVEKIAFNTSHFAAMLGYRFRGGAEAIAFTTPGRFPIDPGMKLTPGNFLSSPGLWIGLAVTAAFLASAVRLRRYRGPI